jgi:SnoaL-like domain
MTDDILARLDRVESTLAIQQLACRYAMAVDARDIDGWLALFIEDVDCGRRGKGREALRGFIEPAVRQFYRSVHLVCGHVIDFVDADNATGRVYSRAEHEVGDRWIVQACCYFDRYQRRDGRWYFVLRDEDFFYTADLLERPQEADFRRWPGPAPKHEPGMMLTRSPSWAAFWAGSDPQDIARITDSPGPDA